MESESAQSPHRMIALATRQALVEDARRARTGLAGGGTLTLVGMCIAGLTWQGQLGLILTLLAGGIGLVLGCFGLAYIGRAAYTIRAVKRRVRELDILALPPARVLVRPR